MTIDLKCLKCGAAAEDVSSADDRIDMWCDNCKKAYYMREENITENYEGNNDE